MFRCDFIRLLFSFFFFVKQKTAYEMRISDWSSDVCSSDLNGMGRIASVSRTSGKAGRVAQILTPGAAIVTAPAAMPQPRNAHPVTRQEAGHPFSQRGDDPDNLMEIGRA